ncbi:MAG: LacI family DNA-binding transcriptional regulator [Anaerolineaceae bacterium]|nr:LacI family DNA-binding transcriptional regulator [Anaerolineaceae bacterium]
MITIREVAREAGVSVGTVSNVLNDPSIVSPATCERVLRVMRQRNYRPSAIARSLATGRTRSFGLVVSNIFNPFTAGIVQGAGEIAREAGCSLLIACAEDDCQDVPRQVQVLQQHWVDGIFLATQPLPESVWRELRFGRTPVVIMDRDQPPLEEHASIIGFDWFMAGQQAAGHLIGLGHRRIGFVGGIPGRSSSVQREKGFRRAMAGAGIHLDERLQRDGDYSTDSGRRCAEDLLDQPRDMRPTALVMGNDMMALGAYEAADLLGLSVPHDLSITGIDDNYFVTHMAPPLTSVHVPTRELGREGMRMLVSGAAGAQRVSLPTRLVTRQSTAAPPQHPAQRDQSLSIHAASAGQPALTAAVARD